MGKIIEGVWDCPYCNSKKIRGSIYECPVCGRQRDIDIKFYIDNPHNYLSDEEARKLNKNPDWICSYCDGLNSDNNENCYNCGASREESELNYLELQEKKRQKEIDELTLQETDKKKETSVNDERDILFERYEDVRSDSKYNENDSENPLDLNNDGVVDLEELMTMMSEKTSLEIENLTKRQSSYKTEETKAQKSGDKLKSGLKIFGIIALIISLIVAGIFIFSPKNEEVTINGFEWERSIEIEEFKTVNESDWSVPAGGRIKETKQEIQSYRDVIDHYETKTRTYTEEVLDHYETEVIGYEDLGNGHFREQTRQVPVYRTEVRTETYEEPVYRQEPVYATKYYYEIDKWVYSETLRVSQMDHSPYWPTKDLSKNEREGQKTETYKINATTKDGEVKTYKMKLNEWTILKVNQQITLKTFIDGSAEIVQEE